MAFLESRLKQIDDYISPPSKEGGLAGIDGIKLGNFFGYHFYTVPLFHHSFKYWKRYLVNNTRDIVHNTTIRCNQQCYNDVNLLHGNTVALFEMDMKKCAEDCKRKWEGSVFGELDVKC